MDNQTKRPITIAERVVLGLVVTMAACAANAGNSTGIDVSSVTSAISDGQSAAGTVGAAALVFIVGIRIFKYLRGAV